MAKGAGQRKREERALSGVTLRPSSVGPRIAKQERALQIARQLAPTPWRPDLARALCELVASGKSMRKSCKQLGINVNAPHRWARDPLCEGFAAEWQAACEARLEVLVDQIVDLADEVKQDGTGAVRAKARIHVRQWLAERLNRRKYGANLTLGGDPSAPITMALARSRVALRLDELAGEVPPPAPGEVPPPVLEGGGMSPSGDIPLEAEVVPGAGGSGWRTGD